MSAIDALISNTNLDPSATRVPWSIAPSVSSANGDPRRQPGSKRARNSEPLNYLHAAARTYHDLGLPITLCQGKSPWQSDWPALEWTPRTIDAAYKLRPATNVGLVLGPRSGLVDFDCDGPEAEQTLLDLFGGEIPETPTWRSRRGLHRLFQWHPALEQLGKNKLVLGDGSTKVELLIGPGAKCLQHAGHPVLRWMAGNVSIEQDAADIWKPSKKKSCERIDGIVALVMGLDLAARTEDSRSIYETPGS